MESLDEDKLDEIARTVRQCGKIAKRKQKSIHRSYKEDGTVLTETDIELSGIIEEKVFNLFPECSFISEEFPSTLKDGAPYTFVLDPIDGTDVYSQGLPSFAVALGILDERRNPVGAYISAPRFGIATEELFVRLDPGGKLKVNGRPFRRLDDKDEIRQVTVGSANQRTVDYSNFSGKARTFGSSIIHLLSPVLFSSIQGCVNQRAYIYDVAAAHAVLLSQGMEIVYKDGSEFVYDDAMYIEKKKYKMDIYAGTEKGIEEMMRLLPVVNPWPEKD